MVMSRIPWRPSPETPPYLAMRRSWQTDAARTRTTELQVLQHVLKLRELRQIRLRRGLHNHAISEMRVPPEVPSNELLAVASLTPGPKACSPSCSPRGYLEVGAHHDLGYRRRSLAKIQGSSVQRAVSSPPTSRRVCKRKA